MDNRESKIWFFPIVEKYENWHLQNVTTYKVDFFIYFFIRYYNVLWNEIKNR